MKKFLSVILIIASIATLFCSCSGVIPKKVGDYSYVVLDDNTAKITQYNGTEEIIELDIPESIDEYTVTVIGKEAFANAQNLTVVNFPTTLLKIEEKAFAGSSVKKAFMHRSQELVEIGAYAFSDCARLIQVDMPRSLTTIADYAFYNCEKLRIAYFRGNTENIATFAFDACPDVKLYVKSEANKVLDYAQKYHLETKITNA